MTPEQRAAKEDQCKRDNCAGCWTCRGDYWVDPELEVARELEALSEEYETADDERRREVYNRLLEIGAGMGSDGIWRARDPEWMRTA